MRLIAFALSLLVVAAPVAAQQVRSATAGTAQPAIAIDDLAWLEGSWSGDGISGPATETYSRLAGGQLTGHFVQEDGKGGIAFTEIVHIGSVDGVFAYRVRHFDAAMKGWEDAKGTPVAFPLVAVEPGRWFFDGLTIHREADDRMTMWVRIGSGDAAREMPFRFRRVR